MLQTIKNNLPPVKVQKSSVKMRNILDMRREQLRIPRPIMLKMAITYTDRMITGEEQLFDYEIRELLVIMENSKGTNYAKG